MYAGHVDYAAIFHIGEEYEFSESFSNINEMFEITDFHYLNNLLLLYNAVEIRIVNVQFEGRDEKEGYEFFQQLEKMRHKKTEYEGIAK